MKAAEDYIKTFSDLIKAQGYISQQVFNCDETGLFWKKMPNRTYITAEEKMMPGHKPMKDIDSSTVHQCEWQLQDQASARIPFGKPQSI
ncbi:tigger transposable element-derived protein 1 [Nephila pilipes]|uniref:Tigger transposable element-derived protein 1 n=1 Tax=Nephila pilipes TaxID=299642 RepID=A0A8X6UU04_NEPPI|nr:tigger transposable element-derived protein 1 [Nephila pilipes]GFU51990.1 tigger transposable element-derived protein 1 [Nephila pilipes]